MHVKQRRLGMGVDPAIDPLTHENENQLLRSQESGSDNLDIPCTRDRFPELADPTTSIIAISTDSPQSVDGRAPVDSLNPSNKSSLLWGMYCSQV